MLHFQKKFLEIHPSPGRYQDYANALLRAKKRAQGITVLNKMYRRYKKNGTLGFLARIYATDRRWSRARRYWNRIRRHVVKQRGRTIHLNGEDAHIVSRHRLPRLRPWARGDKYELAYWTLRGEYIRWNLRVTRSGRYRIILASACPGARSLMQLKIGGQRAAFRVHPSWSIKRKDTGKTIYLRRGRFRAILRPANRRKAANMNFRGIILERVD